MDDRFDEVVWSPKSQQDLDNILEYYQEFNKDTANSKVVNIITKTEEMVFSKQYQIDEFDSTCRRLFVEKKFRVPPAGAGLRPVPHNRGNSPLWRASVTRDQSWL